MSDTSAGADGFPLFVDDRHDLPLQLHYELDDRPLSVWAFRVYAHFVRRAGRNGRIYPTYKSIAETCFRSTFPDAKPETLRRRAMEAVKELEGQGLIRVHRSKAADGDNNPNTYFLTPRSAWHPLVQCTPPGAMHPPGATHPEVNQVQANQDSRKTHVISPDGEAHAPTPTEPDSEQEQPSPALSDSIQTAGKGSRQGKAASSEKVPGAAAALLALWNDHRGPLPRADVLTDTRAKALERLSTALGGEAPALFRDAVCEVALDPFWKERRYGLDNLLNKVPQKAEAYRARTQKASASPLARRRYD